MPMKIWGPLPRIIFICLGDYQELQRYEERHSNGVNWLGKILWHSLERSIIKILRMEIVYVEYYRVVLNMHETNYFYVELGVH